MESHIIKVNAIDKLTPDVLRIQTAKPIGYVFVPGQATELSINKEYWNKEKRPFTFTSLPSDDYLEFVIKIYPAHKGFTNELLKLAPGDELIAHDVWGAIHFKGPGLFIAGGAGITPFISIFRQLSRQDCLKGNRLIFANKRKEDVILENELNELLGKDMVSVLSEELVQGHSHGFITESVLKESLPGYNENLYVCGPPPMMDVVMRGLINIGVSDKLITVEL